MNSKLIFVVFMVVLELSSFLGAAKVGRYYCRKGCEACGRKTQKTRKFTSVEKFSAGALKQAFDEDISVAGNLCESCDRAVRKAMRSSGNNGVTKVSWLIAFVFLRPTLVSNSHILNSNSILKILGKDSVSSSFTMPEP